MATFRTSRLLRVQTAAQTAARRLSRYVAWFVTCALRMHRSRSGSSNSPTCVWAAEGNGVPGHQGDIAIKAGRSAVERGDQRAAQLQPRRRGGTGQRGSANGARRIAAVAASRVAALHSDLRRKPFPGGLVLVREIDVDD